MAKMKKWRVVLDAAKAPTCGDWVAVSGLCPGEEETARFLFLDGTEAHGFTFLDAPQEKVGASPNGEQVPWLHFPDCMEIVGVERQYWRPPSWPHDKTLWCLTLVSLPSNVEFEKRLLVGQESRRGVLSRLGLR
ncbi:hypothetical protein JQW78_23370 [Sulfitobacter pseudonitzschiae]|nr:hypothetical protein [Pseudosulfitobacter pseudonitzschiae]